MEKYGLSYDLFTGIVCGVDNLRHSGRKMGSMNVNVARELEFFELGSKEEPLYQIAKEALFRHTRKQLVNLEDIVLRDTLQRHRRSLTYEQLAEKLGYSHQRTTEVGAKLWAKLTDALGTAKISRKTAYSTLNQILDDQPSEPQGEVDAIALPKKSEELYVERSPIECNALGALMQPGGWFRMSGPEGMGKSTLLDQVLLELRRRDLQTVTVDFTLMGNGTFKDLRSLLRRFCLEVGRKLGLPNAMAEY